MYYLIGVQSWSMKGRNRMSDLSKEQQKELELIASEIEAEAIQMRLDYEATGSEESGSIIFVNENSPLLEDENKELGNTMIVGHFKNQTEEENE